MGEESGQLDLEIGKGFPGRTSAETASLPSSSASGHRDPRLATLAYEMNKKLSELTITPYQMYSIYRVPADLREAAGEDYEPKLVSIGPLHRGKDRLLPMEKVKLMYLQDLLNRDQTNKVENYLEEILKFVQQVREHYSEIIDLSDEEFVEMLVIDGCFIIEYWVKRIFDAENTPLLAGSRWGFTHLRRDLLLLENQIPFLVLDRLFERTKIPFSGSDKEPLRLMELAVFYLRIDPQREKDLERSKPHHLLHLHHLSLDPDKFEEPYRRCFSQIARLPVKKLTDLNSMLFFGVLYLIIFLRFPPLLSATKISKAPRMIPCVTELLQAGIKFNRKKTSKGGKDCPLKVSFNDGSLEIPFLAMEALTGPRLRNLVALEQGRKDIKGYVTSYCIFMNNIINTAGDVAILHSRGILENKLGSDDEVVELFNGLCKGTHHSYDTHHNTELFRKVVDFCEAPPQKWRASFFQKYNKWRANVLSIRWTLISLLAGVSLLILTATQTYFTVFPRQ